MPKIKNDGKTSAVRSRSTDRGDVRPGVLVRINNYQAWLTQDEAADLENQLIRERVSR